MSTVMGGFATSVVFSVAHSSLETSFAPIQSLALLGYNRPHSSQNSALAGDIRGSHKNTHSGWEVNAVVDRGRTEMATTQLLSVTECGELQVAQAAGHWDGAERPEGSMGLIMNWKVGQPTQGGDCPLGGQVTCWVIKWGIVVERAYYYLIRLHIKARLAMAIFD